jgi:hypothetical protein
MYYWVKFGGERTAAKLTGRRKIRVHLYGIIIFTSRVLGAGNSIIIPFADG